MHMLSLFDVSVVDPSAASVWLPGYSEVVTLASTFKFRQIWSEEELGLTK